MTGSGRREWLATEGETRTVSAALVVAVGAALQRLRELWFALTQMSVAASLAWYLAHDVLHHRQPFFAPTAAAVCLSVSNVLRAQRAVQMMIGVALGIGVGAVVQVPFGNGPIAMAAALFIALSAAVLIGHGFIAHGVMFINQTAVSTILVLALAHSGIVSERLFDAMLGGGLALVFSILLFPADPLKLLRSARVDMAVALRDILDRAADVVARQAVAAPDESLLAIDHVHQQLGGLIDARVTARLVMRTAPRRWRVRGEVVGADRQAARLALLAVSVVQLSRAVTDVSAVCDGVRQAVHAALSDLAAGIAAVETDPVAASAHAAGARGHADALHSVVRDRSEVALADTVLACVEDLQRVLDLRCQ